MEKYFGKLTDEALFVADKESTHCTDPIGGLNKNGTRDYCIFQINQEPKTLNDIDLCVKRAWEKYDGGRIGAKNWSAWYTVCTVGPNPQPKYKEITNCN